MEKWICRANHVPCDASFTTAQERDAHEQEMHVGDEATVRFYNQSQGATIVRTNEVVNLTPNAGPLKMHVRINEPFNQLTPAQVERLAILSEELGEVQQVIGKILRHGYDSCHPSDPDSVTNRTLLENEIGDTSYAIRRLIDDGELKRANLEIAADSKAERVRQYLHHNKDQDGEVIEAQESDEEEDEEEEEK